MQHHGGVVGFLTAEWFARVRAEAGPVERTPAEVVLGQVVTDGPEGEVRYRVEVRRGRASLMAGSTGDADMTFTCDYTTASAIASGALSTQSALLQGRIRVAGSPAALLARRAPRLGAPGEDIVDPVPAAVRAETTFS
jgi:hypothetical protein